MTSDGDRFGTNPMGSSGREHKPPEKRSSGPDYIDGAEYLFVPYDRRISTARKKLARAIVIGLFVFVMMITRTPVTGPVENWLPIFFVKAVVVLFPVGFVYIAILWAASEPK